MRDVCRFLLRAFIPCVVATSLMATPARADVSVAVSFFYDDLRPYGRWVEVDDYGECWVPYVRAGWRPYLDGRWVWTDYGWTWVAEEDWGWAPFHYGRWFLDARYGWVWVPGSEWAPAWVSWRYGSDYVGWAPLPPRARWVAGIGLDLGGADLDLIIAPRAYTFVPQRRFVETRVRSCALPVARNTTLVRVTRDSTDYSWSGRAIVNRGVSVDAIERASRRPVRHFQVRDAAGHERDRGLIRGREVTLFRPHVTRETVRRQRETAERHPDVRRLSKQAAGERPMAEQHRERESRLRDHASERQREAETHARRNQARDDERRAAERRQAQSRRQAERPLAEQHRGRERQEHRESGARAQRDEARAHTGEQRESRGAERADRSPQLERKHRQAEEQAQTRPRGRKRHGDNAERPEPHRQ